MKERLRNIWASIILGGAIALVIGTMVSWIVMAYALVGIHHELTVLNGAMNW